MRQRCRSCHCFTEDPRNAPWDDSGIPHRMRLNHRTCLASRAPSPLPAIFGCVFRLLAVPFLASAGLLVLAGLPKVRNPLPLVRALRSVGLPTPRPLVRGFAASEVALGGLAGLRPGPVTAGLVCAAYLLFTAFVVLALRRGGVLGSCGCFGRADTVPTTAHAVLTAAAAATAGAVAFGPPGGWVSIGTHPALVLGCAALVAFLAYQVVAVLPATTPAALRSVKAGSS